MTSMTSMACVTSMTSNLKLYVYRSVLSQQQVRCQQRVHCQKQSHPWCLFMTCMKGNEYEYDKHMTTMTLNVKQSVLGFSALRYQRVQAANLLLAANFSITYNNARVTPRHPRDQKDDDIMWRQHHYDVNSHANLLLDPAADLLLSEDRVNTWD